MEEIVTVGNVMKGIDNVSHTHTHTHTETERCQKAK